MSEVLATDPGPYGAVVLADSIAYGSRLTTLVCTFPRIVLAEFNTHRVFSRNSASSRAIPVKKRIDSVMFGPYVPEAFKANVKGMQPGQALSDDDNEHAYKVWLSARDAAVKHARELEAIGVHKQWANRLLEPFSWHTVIVTATDWDNYFNLRISEHAQDEIRKVSESMKTAMQSSSPAELKVGEWHLPLVTEEERSQFSENELAQLSTARCARVSYLTHAGIRDVAADFQLYKRLVTAGHMSPTEHCAKVHLNTMLAPHDSSNRSNFQYPWLQYRKMLPGESVYQEK